MLQPTPWNPVVETDFETNIRRVRPFLGILLVASFGLYVAHIIYQSVTELTSAFQPGESIGVTGTLALATPTEPAYGSLLTFSSSVLGETTDKAQAYITAMCFQGDKLVYQFSGKPNVKFLLTDPLEPGLDWNGGPALCNASLIYRVPGDKRAELYMLDSISFPVAARL